MLSSDNGNSGDWPYSCRRCCAVSRWCTPLRRYDGGFVHGGRRGFCRCNTLGNLSKLFDNVVNGTSPFSEDQADRLGAIAVMALSYFALDAMFSFAFIANPFPEIGFGMVTNDGIAEPTLNLNVGMLAFSAIMYSLSAIFRYAALLQQLSDETV